MGRSKHSEAKKGKKSAGWFDGGNIPEIPARQTSATAVAEPPAQKFSGEGFKSGQKKTRAAKLAEARDEQRAAKSETAKQVTKKDKVKKEPVVKAPVIGGKTVLKTGKLSARDLPCLCGCGNKTHTRDARFISGHDATLRKSLLNGGKAPAVIMPFFEAGEIIAGVGYEGGEFVDMKPTAGGGKKVQDEDEDEGDEE